MLTTKLHISFLGKDVTYLVVPDLNGSNAEKQKKPPAAQQREAFHNV